MKRETYSFFANLDKAVGKTGSIPIHILILLCVYATAYAPMRTIDTYRQTKPLRYEMKKGGKRTEHLTAGL